MKLPIKVCKVNDLPMHEKIDKGCRCIEETIEGYIFMRKGLVDTHFFARRV